jgi:phospholipase/lecithinase/hemolysin
MAGGGRYGLTNLTVPCLQGLPGSVPGAPSCDVSVFADAIHPTTRVHQIFGQSLATYVTTGVNVAVDPRAGHVRPRRRRAGDPRRGPPGAARAA